MNTYDLKTVMTFAVAAHKQNNEEYINYGRVTNKTIIQSHLGELAETAQCFVDHVTDDCAETAEKIIQYYKGLTFKAMGGKINDFEQRVLAVVQRGVVDRRDIGVVASLPKAYFRGVDRDAKDIEMRKLSKNSDFVSSVGEKVTGKIVVMNCSYIQSLNCFVVNAHMGKDIVCFFTKHNADHWGEGCNIEGRVKRHQTSKFHGGKETVLNYVKTVDKA